MLNGYRVDWCYLKLVDKSPQFFLAKGIGESCYGSHDV